METVNILTSIVQHPPKWDLGFHMHDSFEFAVVLEGTGIFEAKNKIYPIQKGNVIGISSQIEHRYRATTSIQFAVFEGFFFPNEFLCWFNTFTGERGITITNLSFIELEGYELLFRQWLRIISKPLHQHNEVIQSWAKILILYITENSRKGDEALSISNASDYIRANIQTEIRISDLAVLVGMSESYFRKMFRNTYGVSPKRYQQLVRLHESKLLLRSTDKSIQEIATKVGFLDLQAFSAWFQREMGLSPSKWKKQQQRL